MKKTLYTEQQQTLLAALREARNAAGLSQAEVAERLHSTQSDVSKCERGVRRLDVIELHAWCNALGIQFMDFSRDLDFRFGAIADRHVHKIGRRSRESLKKP
ncbi:helix-turn-helix domain-containing protein [Roseateles toxinivorans]|uniref:helix-turn-helix domain-containing protein n=1 Tax=Roseateles toxinivorans TaxID=270368 RepID=UPI001060DBDF|nr:helix-turn-helix transcriptional regulator [Roseateles toxinivorans]